jgi:tRNA A-37 threonylcarbamoyl transferase component Bud32
MMKNLNSSSSILNSPTLKIHSQPSKIYAGIKKSSSTKTYFFVDKDGNDVDLISHPRQTAYERTEKSGNGSSPKSIGKGNFGQIFTKYSSNATVVKKKLNRDNDAFNKYRLKALKNLHLNSEFRRACAENICIPFQIEKDPNVFYMKKLNGMSLEDVISKGKIELTKKQIMELHLIIKRLAHEFHIVHTAIHAGNVMFSNEKLVLIDFDDCISKTSLRKIRRIDNPKYIEEPDEEDYLSGYEKDTPPQIQAPYLDDDEQGFHVDNDLFEQELTSSLKKYEKIFEYDGRPLFESEEFKLIPHDNNEIKFLLTIIQRAGSNSNEGQEERFY